MSLRAGLRWLLVVAIVLHLPLLFDAAGFFDGRLLESLADHGRFHEIKRWFYQAGLQPEYWLHRGIWLLPAPGWMHRLVSFGSVFGIGAIAYSLANTYTTLSRLETLALACLIVAFPAYHVLVSITSIIYILPTFLLYLGWWLYFEGRVESRGWRFTVPAYALMFVAFVHNSLLVFHFGFACFAVWILVARGKRIVDAVKHVWLVLLIPVAFQLAKMVFFKPRGLYAGYNEIVLLDGKIPLTQRLRLVGAELVAYVGSPWVLAAVPVVALLVWWLWRRRAISALTVKIAIAGALFYGAAVFPYLVVGKGPTPGLLWTDRYELQTALGLALLVLALARLAGELVRVRGALLEAIVLGLGWLWLAGRLERAYLTWTARAAREAAIVAELHALAPPAPGTVLVWRDDNPIGDETYRFYELDDLLGEAWGSERWVAFDGHGAETLPKVEALLTRGMRSSYSASEFQANGCQGEIVISSGPRPREGLELPLAYLATSWSSARRADMLEGLITVKLVLAACPPP